MDDRGNPYKKGRAGHARNVNSYLVYRQKMKRWKYPFIATGVFLMFLFSFEISGDILKTSVLDSLSNGAPFIFTNENFDTGKKTLVAFIKEMIDNCKGVSLDECAASGKILLHSVSQASSLSAAQKLLVDVEAFEAVWSAAIANAKCEKDTSYALDRFSAAFHQFKKSVRSHENSLVDAADVSNSLREIEARLSKLSLRCNSS